jgi:hypothetical protein
MFRYRLHSPDGDDLGEATYAMRIKPGEEIHLGAGQRLYAATFSSRSLPSVEKPPATAPRAGCRQPRPFDRAHLG